MLVIGLGGSMISFGTFEIYGMSLAALVGIVLNLLLPRSKKEPDTEPLTALEEEKK